MRAVGRHTSQLGHPRPECSEQAEGPRALFQLGGDLVHASQVVAHRRQGLAVGAASTAFDERPVADPEPEDEPAWMKGGESAARSRLSRRMEAAIAASGPLSPEITGLAHSPGTAVDPTCSISSATGPSRAEPPPVADRARDRCPARSTQRRCWRRRRHRAARV
jgi:hypothetical protein